MGKTEIKLWKESFVLNYNKLVLNYKKKYIILIFNTLKNYRCSISCVLSSMKDQKIITFFVPMFMKLYQI